MTSQNQPAQESGQGRQRRILGLTGQGAGIVGIIISLVLILGVVWARGWALDTVDSIQTRVDDGLAKGIPLIDTASAKVDEVSGKVTTVAAAATAVSAVNSPAAAIIKKLDDAVSGLSEKYLALRASYMDARGSISSVLDRLNTIDAAVPFFSIPQGPVDKLQALDARIQEMDSSVMEILQTTGSGGAVSTLAKTVAERATTLEGRLANLSTQLDEARTKLDALRAEVASTASTATTAINIITVVAILLLLYLVLLHVVLYRSAKGMGRAPTA